MNIQTIRQVVLDTETTGMNKFHPFYKGHRIIEIAAVEIVNRKLTGKYFHVYINPLRSIDIDVFNVHGISDEFLLDKPIFSEIVDEFLEFLDTSELIIHNASFDIEFINQELLMLSRHAEKINDTHKIIDSLALARKIFPGKRNNLDALCDRYCINRSKRNLHGALLDAEILANIYLLMTSSQSSIQFKERDNQDLKKQIKQLSNFKKFTKVIYANCDEVLLHKKQLSSIKETYGVCVWKDNFKE